MEKIRNRDDVRRWNYSGKFQGPLSNQNGPRRSEVTISDKGDSYLTTQDSQTSQNTTNTVSGLQRAQTKNQHTFYFVRVLVICDILRTSRRGAWTFSPWTDFDSWWPWESTYKKHEFLIFTSSKSCTKIFAPMDAYIDENFYSRFWTGKNSNFKIFFSKTLIRCPNLGISESFIYGP